MGLIEHLESYLGPIQGGWKRDSTGEAMPFQVAEFERGPDENSVAVATLGLGRYHLTSPASGKPIHHEFVMLARRSGASDAALMAGLLQQVGLEILTSRRPVLRGEVIGPRGSLFGRGALTALFASALTYFPDDFARCHENGVDIVLVWLAPITTDEASFVATHGWDIFEDLLVAEDPDLLDFDRGTVRGVH